MVLRDDLLKVPKDFDFPFPPYPIQKDFMENLYQTIEEGKLGIFESPTGTGKSLSLICGALRWLKDHEEREKRELTKSIEKLKPDDSDQGDWLMAQAKNKENEIMRRQLQKQLEEINKKEEKIKKIRETYRDKGGKYEKKFGMKRDMKGSEDLSITENNDLPEEDSDLLLEELREVDEDLPSDDEKDPEDKPKGVKIIFCSRTHSQLSQFVNEVKRTVFKENTTLIPLASRQSYCINKTVKKLNSLSLINEKCLDLQKASKGKTTSTGEDGERLKKSKGTSGCPMMKGIMSLSEEAVAEVHDVEELSALGSSKQSCPYYASRGAVENAEVVVVPYNILLHKSTREACGLNIEGSVVIVDEAHNLLDTITNIHSTLVTGQQLTHSYSQLTQYRDKYLTRFSAANLLYLKQLIYVVGSLIKLIGGKPGCGPAEGSSKVIDSKMYEISDFILTAEIDIYNLYKITEFCKNSKLMHKLHGFSEKYTPAVKVTQKPNAGAGIRAFLKEISNKNQPVEEKTEPSPPEKTDGPSQPLVGVVALLEGLTSNDSDGRVVLTRAQTVGKAVIKYVLLNPAPTFADIVQKARSVILAGGTMQPVSEFTDQLFLRCGATAQRLHQFSCGHVIPPENILPLILCHGPTGRQLDFSYQSRSSTAILNEVGRILTNVCNLVPSGVVCFFPSYDYEEAVYQHLDKNGFLEKISAKKKVFREPKKSSQVDTVLSDYAKYIAQCRKDPGRSQNGCLLFSVVGGKLSEGLNFSDDLGRCVIVVGMPYPNIKSQELQEKMSYLDKHVGNGAGKIHYENLCMKAVNQSIGRAVRHKGDYSSMLLLDHRYARESVQEQLPGWIRKSVQVHEKFGPAVSQIVKFFKDRDPKKA